MKAGDKVVCVDDHPSDNCKAMGCTVKHILKNEIYTIRRVDGDFIHLVDVGPDGGWYKWRFRPVTSIDLWQTDEQEAYLEALEILMPGVLVENWKP